jgi:hypothetical protein
LGIFLSEPQVDKAPHIHLPRRRRSSPWRLAVLVVCIIGVIVLAPVWLDPLTLHEILGASSAPTSAEPLETYAYRPATNAPVLRGSPLAADDFNREVATGFGAAKSGAGYVQTGSGTIFVTGGRATISLDDGAAGAATLTDASLTVVDELATVQLESGAPSARVGLAARFNDGSFYAGIIGFSGGVASASIASVVNGEWQMIAGPVTLEAVDAAQPIRLRFDSTDLDPTALRLRAWNVGTVEPGQWSVTILGWASQLQQPGSIGLAWSLSDDRHSVVAVDDLAAQGYLR